MGDGAVTIKDKSKIHMNDNRWHSVTIRRPGPKIHSMTVDDTIETYVTTGNNMHLNLDGILYIGGVFKDMYAGLPTTVASRVGFEGCLASMDLADISASLTDDAVVPSSLVVNGCEGPTKCSQNACANRGICVQQWNAYACECDMTSFTGPTCYDGKRHSLYIKISYLHHDFISSEYKLKSMKLFTQKANLSRFIKLFQNSSSNSFRNSHKNLPNTFINSQ